MALAAWQATIVNESGDVQANAQIRVRLESTGADAAIYSDRDGMTPLANPFQADSDGFARFYAPGGAYRIDATLGGFSHTWNHVAIGLLAESDRATDDLLHYSRTDAEISAGVTPVNYAYPPGDLRRYGADKTGAQDSHAAIQAAVDVAEKLYQQDTLNQFYGGARIKIPAGRFRVTEPIVIKKRGIEFAGEGRASVIFCDDAFPENRAIIQSRERSDRGTSGSSITLVVRDLALYDSDPDTNDYQSPFTPSRRGVWVTGMDGGNGPCGFYNVFFRGFQEALMLAGCWRFDVWGCSFMGGRANNQVGTGLSFGDFNATDAENYSATGSYTVNIPTVIGNRFQFLNRAARFEIVSGGSWISNTIENCTSASGVVLLNQVSGVFFGGGGYHEQNAGPVFTLGGTSSSNRVRNCVFKGLFFTTRATGTNTCDFRLQNLEACEITGNRHSSTSPGSDVISASSNFNCTSSDIRYGTISEGTTIDRDSNMVRALDANYPTSILRPNARVMNQQNDNYTLQKTDCGKRVKHTSGTANAWTIPPSTDVAWESGDEILLQNTGSGAVTITRGDGVALNFSAAGAAVADQNCTLGQGGWAVLIYAGSNVWDVFGNSALS